MKIWRWGEDREKRQIGRKDKENKKGRKQFFSEMYPHRISYKCYIQLWSPHSYWEMVRVQAGLLVNHILIVQHRHPVTLQTYLKPFCQARLVINSGEPTSASLPVRHSILSEFCRWCQNPGLVAKQLRFSRQVSTPCNPTCKIQDGHSCLDKCLLEK